MFEQAGASPHNPSMRTELISIDTDTHPLDGAYYEPDEEDFSGEIIGSVQLFHGNTMNFYVGAPRFLPPMLTKLGYACLSYNRRGHDVLSTRDSRNLEGGAFQTTAQAIDDNNYARDWLMEKGFGAPVCIGHSNGGMLAVRHAAGHKDTPALVLLSAHRGGKNIAEISSRNGLWAQDRLDEVRDQAQSLMAAGLPLQLIPLPGWWNVTSAVSALDYINNVPDILQFAPEISCPVLYLRGDQEPAELYPVEEFQRACTGTVDAEIVSDCNHFYVGREDEICRVVGGWLAGKVVGPG